jgi:hypothetical protein
MAAVRQWIRLSKSHTVKLAAVFRCETPVDPSEHLARVEFAAPFESRDSGVSSSEGNLGLEFADLESTCRLLWLGAVQVAPAN